MNSDTKILLIVPRYNLTNKISYRYNFPFGLGYISAALKRAGYHVDCLNLNHCNGYIKDNINLYLNNTRYDYAMSGNFAVGYAILETIVESIQAHESRPTIVLGGPLINSEPELVLTSLNPDYIVIGEGEETVVELLDCLKNGGELSEVNGIGFKDKDGNTILTKGREPVKDLDSLPYPDFEGLDMEKQLDNAHLNDFFYNAIFDYARTYTILGSRGCPYKCTFCYHYAAYRPRTIDSVMEEIRYVTNRFKINNLITFDECFAVKKERLYEFCDRITKFREELPWDFRWACQLPVHAADKDVLKALKASGCYSVGYGFESYNSSVLRSMHKPIKSPEQIDQVFKATLDAGMGAMGNFIFGDVAETAESAYETLEYWKHNCRGQVSMCFIQPYPGSEIYKHCLRKGIIKDKLSFIKYELAYGRVRNMTDNMTDEEIRKLKNDMYDALSKYREYVRPSAMKKTGDDSYSIEFSCPYCKEHLIYNNCHIENRFTYGFLTQCRNCYMTFHLVSISQKIAAKYYPVARNLRAVQVTIFDFLKKKMLKRHKFRF